MNAKDAYTLLETLLDGIDPLTGEMLPEEHVCQEPAVLRALHRALVALQNEADADDEANAADERKTRYPRAGRPWTQEDLERLKQLYEDGTSMEEMCHLLQRRKSGIEKKCVYLGLTDAKSRKRSHSGRPWTGDEDKTLWDLWKNGAPEENIARLLRRTPYAVHCRMERMGMLDPEDGDAQPLLPPWSLADVQKLQRLHAGGCSPEEIAADMHRPVESVRARMFYMGLTKDAPISLRPQK